MRSKKLNWCIFSICLFLLFSIISIWTFRDYGMGWDEELRWISADAKLDYYAKLFSAEDYREVMRDSGTDRYPGLFDIPLAVIHQQTGWNRFVLGHVGSWLFALAGLGAVWLTAWRLGGGRLAFWSVLLLLLVPPFYGHIFHNPKDIPFAAMYALGLCGLVFLAYDLPRLRWKWVVLAGIFCGLAMSVRIAGMVLICYSIALFGLVLVQQVLIARNDGAPPSPESATLRRWAPHLLAVPVLALVAFLTLLPWWPAGHGNILAASGESLQDLHVRASSIPLLFRGTVVPSAEAPFYYTIWMFLIKTPEAWLLLLAGAVALSVARLRAGVFETLRSLSPAWAMIVLGGFFPLFYLTLSAPSLHNGARHFLFVYPPLAIVAAHGLLALNRTLAEKERRALIAFRVAITVLLAFPLVHLIALHPYQYVYFNQLAGGPSGAYGRYETEYWFTSNKHALEWLDDYVNESGYPSGDDGSPVVYVSGTFRTARLFVPEGFTRTRNPAEADYIIANTQMMIHTLFEGDVIHVEERMGLPIYVIIRTAQE